MDQLTTKELREARALAAEAEVRELESPLRDLAGAFADWRRWRRVDAVALVDLVHDVDADELGRIRKTYERLDATDLVARAIECGLIEQGEVPAGLLRKLQAAIARVAEEEDDLGEG